MADDGGTQRVARRNRDRLRPTLDPQLFRASQRLGLHFVDLMHEARDAGELRRPRRSQTLAAGDQQIAVAVTPNDQRLHDSVRSDRSHERLEVVGDWRSGRLNLFDRDGAQRLIARTCAQLLHVVGVGAHAISRRQSFSLAFNNPGGSLELLTEQFAQVLVQFFGVACAAGGQVGRVEVRHARSLRDEH